MSQTTNVQDTFLNTLRKDKVTVSVFLVNGIKLVGTVVSFDNFAVMLGSQSGIPQLIYKHAISTILPSGPVSLQPVKKSRETVGA